MLNVGSHNLSVDVYESSMMYDTPFLNAECTSSSLNPASPCFLATSAYWAAIGARGLNRVPKASKPRRRCFLLDIPRKLGPCMGGKGRDAELYFYARGGFGILDTMTDDCFNKV